MIARSRFLKELAQPKKRAKGSSDWRLSEHIELIAPTVLLEQLSNTIRLEYIDRLVPSWDKMYAELAACTESGSLGRWCAHQRRFRKRGDITPERITRLDAIGFDWNPIITVWDKRYAELVAYIEANGHCEVAFENGTSPLGAWCATQRRFAKKAKLPPERIARLDALGFCWDAGDAIWDKNCTALVAFKEAHGHFSQFGFGHCFVETY
jgi:hypothetical protein